MRAPRVAGLVVACAVLSFGLPAVASKGTSRGTADSAARARTLLRRAQVPTLRLSPKARRWGLRVAAAPTATGASPAALAVIAPVVTGFPSGHARRLRATMGQYAGRLPGYKPTARKPIDGRRLGMFVGCAGWGLKCAVKIGRSLRAAWVLLATVKRRSSKKPLISVWLIRMATGGTRMANRDAAGPSIKDLTAALDQALYDLFKIPRGPGLTVTGSPAGAVIRVNGRKLGSLPLMRVAGLQAGSVVLEVSAPKHLPRRMPINLQPGRMTTLKVQLRREAPPPVAIKPGPGTVQPPVSSPIARPTPPKPRGPRGGGVPIYKRWWFWTGVAAVAGGTTAAVLLLRPKTEPGPQKGLVRAVIRLRWP